MSEQTSSTISISNNQSSSQQAPASRVTMPEFVEWHMILDGELEVLSRPATGVLGSIGFMALGGVASLGGSFVLSLEKLESVPAKPLDSGDFTNSCFFIGCLVAAIICLLLFSISLVKNKDLVSKIRMREKHRVPSSAA